MYAIEAPSTATAARGGLMRHANVIDGADTQVFWQGVEYQESYLLGHNKPIPTDGSDKVFDEVGLIESEKFGSYRGVDYSMLQSAVNPTAVVKEAFEAGESWAVERAVEDLLFSAQAVDITPTAGTPVTDKLRAIGILEQYAADTYSGLPLIHANKLVTSELSEFLEVEKPAFDLFTKQGLPVANGGGYASIGPGGVAAPANAGWVYLTGQVHVWRSAITLAEAPEYRRNRKQALAERTYVAAVDSFVAAILVGI